MESIVSADEIHLLLPPEDYCAKEANKLYERVVCAAVSGCSTNPDLAPRGVAQWSLDTADAIIDELNKRGRLN